MRMAVFKCRGRSRQQPGGLERIPIMLQYILHERRIWRHFGGQPSHELTDAAAKRIPETESPAKTPPFRTPWKSRFNPNGNRSRGVEIELCRIPTRSEGSETRRIPSSPTAQNSVHSIHSTSA